MGKSLTLFQGLTRFIISNRHKESINFGPVSSVRTISSSEPVKRSGGAQRQQRKQLKLKKMGENSERQRESRMPLSDVVSDCVKRWFQDTLKEAKAGDSSMQVLVGQMYCSGYGIPKDAQKGRAWINRASKVRSSAMKVGDKHPGYNVSDSDSDDAKEKRNQD